MISATAASELADAPAPREPIEPVRFDARDLDLQADPRVDLDAFVNARWRARNPVPADRSCWDTFSVLTERTLAIQAEIAEAAASSAAPLGSAERVVGDFWSSGNRDSKTEDIALLKTELARIERLDSSAAIAAYLRDRHARGLGVVFRFDVEAGFADPHRNIAFVSQSGLGLPDRDDYFDASSHGIARRRAYLAHVQAMLELAGCDASVALADDVLAFETELAEVSLPRRVLARDAGARFRPIDIDAADRSTPRFSWSAFFRDLGIDVPARFSLAMPGFFAAMDEALRSTPAPVWRAYLCYHMLDDAAPLCGGEFAAQHHDFHGETLRGQRTPAPHWKRVLDTIDSHAGEAMGQLYVARCFAPESKRVVRALAEELRIALRTRLENLDWMSEETRRAALRKLSALNFKIGYPDRWRDWSGLATNTHSLYANVLAARRFEQRERIARIDQPVDRSLWSMPPQRVNAGYDPHRNEVVFPTAILAPPFFDPDADDAINYGGIGAVIAHELIHAFDDQGSRFDADGRLENWWTAEDRARFDALAARMIERFDAESAGGSDKVDGRLTLGENIADFGGLAVACDALDNASAAETDPLIDGYTRKQRFFLNWAVLWRQNLTLGESYFRIRNDTHAPAGVRANAAAANLAAYANAFACRPGDPMSVAASDRIDVW
jgi:putative endopeptidase